jgi:hypothetical protein
VAASFPSHPTLEAPFVLRLGTAVSLASLSALACTVPATMRVSVAVVHASGSPRVWFALAGAAFAPMLAAILLLRAVRGGLRALAVAGAELRAYELALWFATLGVAIPLFMSRLYSVPHSPVWEGIAYGIGGLTLAAVVAFLCARVAALQRGASSGKRLVIGGVFTLIALAALGWIGLLSLPILSRGAAAPSDSGTIVDVLAFATAALLAARPSLGAWRAMALVGLPVALVVTTLGLSMLRDGPIRTAIDERAPAFAIVAHLAARHY